LPTAFERHVKNSEIFRAFENQEITRRKADPIENIRIVSELYKFAMKLGVFSSTDPLEGIERKIRLAKILNSVKRTPS
jgi:hypothetical protein